MIEFEQIENIYPNAIRQQPNFKEYMLKEYIQLMILNYLSTTSYTKKLSFIGGTNLRLVKGIDRFSEDLDFDCKNLSKEDFYHITNNIITFLRLSGYNIETKDKDNPKLTAYRRNLYFPKLLFDLKLSVFEEKRFLIKIESQDQGFQYTPKITTISRLGFNFPFPIPPDNILCSMKISALLSRQKGRDFYDTMFLLSQTMPDFDYLYYKLNIKNWEELKPLLLDTAKTTNLFHKSEDFKHLLINHNSNNKILAFEDFINQIVSKTNYAPI